MIEGEEEEAGADRRVEQEHIFSEIVKVSREETPLRFLHLQTMNISR